MDTTFLEEWEVTTDNEVDYQVVRELNAEIRAVEKDLMDLNEINENLSRIVNLQGEELDLIEQRIAETASNTTAATYNLEKAEFFTEEKKKVIRDVLIVTGGAIAGALGFIAGPIVGVLAIVSGISVSSGIVFGVHKVTDK